MLIQFTHQMRWEGLYQKKGFLDANHITNLLENEDIHIAISSPYKRAFQTRKKQ